MDTNVVLHGLQVALGLGFVALGAAKVTGVARFALGFARFGYPRWFLTVTGAVELLGGLGLLAAFVWPDLVAPAAALLAATMVGAAVTHLRARDAAAQVAPPLVLLGLVALVAVAAVAG